MAEPVRAVLVIASLGAAAIHFAYAPHHLDENTVHGAFFLAIAWFQLAWGIGLVVRRPDRLMLGVGAAVNAGIIAVWVVSRTAGISGVVEPVGFPDVLSTVLEGLVVVGSLAFITSRLPRTTVQPVSAAVFAGAAGMAAIALVTASIVPSLGGGHSEAGHTHGDTEVAGAAAHDHDATTASADHDHATATGGATDDHSAAAAKVEPYDPALPINLSGTAGVTPKQQAQAENEIAETLERLPQWADYRTAEAAGYRSIGDGSTGVEHFVNKKFMDDDVLLDPDKAESLVYSTKGGGRRLVAAMYMTKTGTPLADVPKIGGKLMQWHVHDNLCYNPEGKVRGITNSKGQCPAGLVKPKETPMIHVWITAHKCGPFAALEGIGGGRIPEGEQRLCDHAHGKGGGS